MLTCDGNGICFKQTSHSGYTKNPHCVCIFDCQLARCTNFMVCEASRPSYILKCMNNKCVDCNIMFGQWCGGKGNLTFFANLDKCCICLGENKVGVSQPKCRHTICLDCFKKCYFTNVDIDEPVFPYGIDEDPDDVKWDNDPLVIKYRDDYDIWEDEQDKLYKEQEELKRCPLCKI